MYMRTAPQQVNTFRHNTSINISNSSSSGSSSSSSTSSGWPLLFVGDVLDPYLLLVGTSSGGRRIGPIRIGSSSSSTSSGWPLLFGSSSSSTSSSFCLVGSG
jgi:hypothetical protein